jgi:hypothetical protein
VFPYSPVLVSRGCHILKVPEREMTYVDVGEFLHIMRSCSSPLLLAKHSKDDEMKQDGACSTYRVHNTYTDDYSPLKTGSAATKAVSQSVGYLVGYLLPS